MGRLPGTKNKTRIEMTLSPWYGDKIKELRAGSGFETDTGFAKWLVQNMCSCCLVSVNQTIND